jgi:hypothetical protein
VFLNALRGFFESPERFDGASLRKVYEGLQEHVELDLQKSLLREVDFRLRSVLQSPRVRETLERGDPGRARLYAVVVGQNNGEAKQASADARDLARLLRTRAGVSPGHLREFASGVTRERLLAVVSRLKTKAVDRVLFYFSGQGRHTSRGQALVLENGELLHLSELARAFQAEGNRAENVAFLLDTSFGDAERGEGRGGRTHARSIPLTPAARKAYLSDLADADRGWQVLCAAGPGEVSGEYEGYGLLTGLLLEELGLEEHTELGLKEIEAHLEEPFGDLGQAFLGGEHTLYSLPRAARRQFPILVRPHTAVAKAPAEESKEE